MRDAEDAEHETPAADGGAVAGDAGADANTDADAPVGESAASTAEDSGVVIDLDADHRDPPSLSALQGVESRVLALDFGVGLLWLAVGFLTRPAGAVREWWWVALAAAGVAAIFLFADERDVLDRFDAYGPEYRRGGLLAVLVLLAAASIATLLGGVAGTVASVALLGVGLGTIWYRATFGLLLPIPRPRLRRAQRLRWIVADLAEEAGNRVQG